MDSLPGDSLMALVSALTNKLTNGNNKNHSESDAALLTLADPNLMRVVKREGHIVPYDRNKILRAVGMCFESVAERIGGMTPEIVTDQVDTILRLKALQFGENGHLAEIGIEAIQDIVEAQLMALGQFEAAKHYILYRDERRRIREESKGISPEMRDFFKKGCDTFTGKNRLLQEVQAFDKFSRFRRDFTPKRREIWPESCKRVIDYYRSHITKIAPGSVSEETWAIMHDYLLHHKATGSMRGIQMAGPALERCQSGIYNCAFGLMDSPELMTEDLYLLMQGVGFGFSVEEEYAVDKWPRIHAKRDCDPVDYTVEDDTEAWCDALKFGLHHWMDGADVNFDLSQIRPAGSILRTKGGRASGPLPLRDLLNFDRDLVFRRQKKRLRSIDLLDMTCMLHRIGQMGGVRRASGLSLSDKDDLLMRDAKKGEFFNTHPWRNQTNNSTAYEEKPTSVDFMDEWMALAKSGSGERGIFNRGGLNYQMPVRRAREHVLGTNPCGEIILRHKEFCNLSIAIVEVDDTYEEIEKKVEIATIWGTIQASMTNFRYLSSEWKFNCEDEALLGVDILGHMDCKLLKPGVSGREEILRRLLKKVQETNVYWAQRIGIKPGAALTCGKPSGDSSVFFDKPARFKPHHGRFYIRRLRFEETNPIAKVLKDAKIPWQFDYDKTGMCVFEFPCRAPDNTIILGDMTAVEQLEDWKTWKVNFTEHNPSITVSVKDHEWIEAGNWVYENWDIVGGISFYPFDNAVYPLAPYQTITEQEYTQRAKVMPTEIDWSRILLYEEEDETTLSAQVACTGPGCDL
jgi:ribonucleoside-diphosphate reductase alpha chain